MGYIWGEVTHLYTNHLYTNFRPGTSVRGVDVCCFLLEKIRTEVMEVLFTSQRQISTTMASQPTPM